MRLLNAKTLKVEEFFGHQIPPYTILSHTWDKDEVSFGDMQSSNFKNKKGFAKIWYACNQTREDGWEYTWIDTCCIDKTSSAELSEAINSMFQWYRDAQVCYAYLADVLEGSGHYGAEIPDAPLEKSRWFTRGWTLQELIAPREVIFYGTEWRPLGRKHEMATELHGITGIDQFVLKIRDGRLLERALEETCAARKMSWASKRETTRPEDIAYCLLGLFGINMPLLYGEGMKAFTRLQQEIARVSNDQTLLAWGFPAEPGKKSRNDATTGPRVFAHDPSYFASAGTVVRHDINGDSFRPWTLTNLGIGLEVAVLRDNWPATCVAILSCHYEDDMRGPIGLRL
ncbi:heterokaryon incompatibility protein-domain-containing protein, partial [Podospora didyma]